MRRLLIILAIALLPAASLGTAFAGDALPEKPVLSGFDVARVELTVPVTKADASGKTITHARAYLVRLHGAFPVTGAQLLKLYFGEERIEEYGGFPGGIYFLVFDKSQLDALSGKEIRFRIGDEKIQPSGATFDAGRFDLKTVLPDKDAFARPLF